LSVSQSSRSHIAWVNLRAGEGGHGRHHLVDKASKALAINWDDELVKATALTRDGKVIHPNFQPKSS